MKRINPETGKIFRRGDVRDDGFIFRRYKTSAKDKQGFFYEQWNSPEVFEKERKRDLERHKVYQTEKYRSSEEYRNKVAVWRKSHYEWMLSTKEGHIKKIFMERRSHAKRNNIPFEVTLEYIEQLAPDNCPVFNRPLLWAQLNGHSQRMSPTLDKINPELGYVPGNVQWLSNMANLMKQNATPEELLQFSEWCIKTLKE